MKSLVSNFILIYFGDYLFYKYDMVKVKVLMKEVGMDKVPIFVDFVIRVGWSMHE